MSTAGSRYESSKKVLDTALAKGMISTTVYGEKMKIADDAYAKRSADEALLFD